MSGGIYKIYEKMAELAWNLNSLRQFPKRVLQLSKVAKQTSFYPEMPRKSDREIWKENFRWLCKDGMPNPYYISHGFDVKDFRNQEEFFGYREFNKALKAGNQKPKHTWDGNYTYIVMLRDKYVFASYLASTIGKQHVVDSVALISDGKACLCKTQHWVEIEELLTDGANLVFKTVDGECANGVMLVKISGGTVLLDDKAMTKSEFAKSLQGQRMVVQNVVTQHSALQAFKTRSVSTIRVVTIKGRSGKVGVFAAFLRLSASPDSFVDNRAKGGLGIGVDLATGQLMKYGMPHDSFGVKVEVHPLSGIRFEGYQLPWWKETVELVCRAHKQFYELQSIGWDVILTEDGPVLLEGNDDWEIGGPQDTYGGLKKKWEELTKA